MFWSQTGFFLNLSTGSTGSQGRARREGLAGKTVVGGSSQFTWWHRGCTGRTVKEKFNVPLLSFKCFLCLSNRCFSFISFSFYKSNLNVRYFYLCNHVFTLQCNESIQWSDLCLTMTYVAGQGFSQVHTFLPVDNHSVNYALWIFVCAYMILSLELSDCMCEIFWC